MNPSALSAQHERGYWKVRYLGATILAILGMVVPARADSISSFNMFADHSIFATGGITSPGGAIGSNGDLFLNGGTLQTVRGGGSLFDNFGGLNTTGDVTVNGNAMIQFFGNVGGNINIGHDANLTANVAGNIVAGGNVNTSGATTGSIFSGGSTTVTGLGTVGGSIHQLSSVVPASYSTTLLPAAHAFTSGGTNFTLATFAAATLAPGSYGDLTMIGSNTINLSSGNYYFNDIQMIGSFATFNFDTTHGPINLFVTGAVFLNDPTMKLNGVAFNSIPTSAAGQVYWETHDNFYVEFANLLGTVYAAFGDIDVMKLSSVNGKLVAGGNIITDGGNFSVGAQSATLAVPEPSALALALAALVGLGLASRRR